MTIPRVWPNGLGYTDMLTSADIARLDGNLQRALDKGPAGDTMYGLLTVGAGGSITWTSGGFWILGIGSGLRTQVGGRIVCGQGDVPILGTAGTPTPRSIIKYHNLYESLNQLGTPLNTSAAPWLPPSPSWSWKVNQAILDGMSPLAANAVMLVPLGRAHDGATLTNVLVTFAVAVGRASLPIRYPGIVVFRSDPFLGTVTPLGANFNPAYLGTPANLAAYINGGSPQNNSIQYTPTANNVIDVSTYLYWLAIIDEDYNGVFSTSIVNTFMGAQLNYSVSDLRHE